MLDHSITMDAEHLMALKHSKSSTFSMAPMPEAPVLIPTTKARKIKEDSSDEEEVGFVPHNRGNKLKRKASAITGGCRLYIPDAENSGGSQGPNDTNEDEIRSNFRRSVVASSGSGSTLTSLSGGPSKLATAISKREVLKIRPVVHGPGIDGVEELSDDENPYAGIKINEILSPLETSTEILQRPQLRKLFHSPQLQIMAVHAMAMIEREKLVNKMMSRVALILQGDDPLYPQLGYGMGEGCSTAMVGKPDQEEFVNGNKEWKEHGEDREQVQKTLSSLVENINCSNQYIDLLNESRDSVNHVLKQRRRLWKKLKEKREGLRHRMQPKNSRLH